MDCIGNTTQIAVRVETLAAVLTALPDGAAVSLLKVDAQGSDLDILESAGAKAKVIELGAEWVPGLLSAESSAIRAELGEMTGQTSMPHIFIRGESIGGLFTGTPGLKPLLESGKLQAKLKVDGSAAPAGAI